MIVAGEAGAADCRIPATLIEVDPPSAFLAFLRALGATFFFDAGDLS